MTIISETDVKKIYANDRSRRELCLKKEQGDDNVKHKCLNVTCFSHLSSFICYSIFVSVLMSISIVVYLILWLKVDFPNSSKLGGISYSLVLKLCNIYILLSHAMSPLTVLKSQETPQHMLFYCLLTMLVATTWLLNDMWILYILGLLTILMYWICKKWTSLSSYYAYKTKKVHHRSRALFTNIDLSHNSERINKFNMELSTALKFENELGERFNTIVDEISSTEHPTSSLKTCEPMNDNLKYTPKCGNYAFNDNFGDRDLFNNSNMLDEVQPVLERPTRVAHTHGSKGRELFVMVGHNQDELESVPICDLLISVLVTTMALITIVVITTILNDYNSDITEYMKHPIFSNIIISIFFTVFIQVIVTLLKIMSIGLRHHVGLTIIISVRTLQSLLVRSNLTQVRDHKLAISGSMAACVTELLTFFMIRALKHTFRLIKNNSSITYYTTLCQTCQKFCNGFCLHREDHVTPDIFMGLHIFSSFVLDVAAILVTNSVSWVACLLAQKITAAPMSAQELVYLEWLPLTILVQIIFEIVTLFLCTVYLQTCLRFNIRHLLHTVLLPKTLLMTSYFIVVSAIVLPHIFKTYLQTYSITLPSVYTAWINNPVWYDEYRLFYVQGIQNEARKYNSNASTVWQWAQDTVYPEPLEIASFIFLNKN
jgi:hypothetical protein